VGMPVPDVLLAIPLAEPRVLLEPELVEPKPPVSDEEELSPLVPDDPNAELELVEDEPNPLDPGDEPNPPDPDDPNAEVEPVGLEPAGLAPVAPGETIPAADPKPVARPASG
jgi:hypothetical protein